MNPRQYKVLAKFQFTFHNGHELETSYAEIGDTVESVRNQVYVITDKKIHTTHYSWLVSKLVHDGFLEEIV